MLKFIIFALFLEISLLSFQDLSAAEPTPPTGNSQDLTSCPKLTGRTVVKGDPHYDKARLVSNYYTSKNKFPRVIVYCHTTQDVQSAVLWARCNKVPIRIRSGGHHHEGYSTGNGALLIDVSEMKELKVDKLTNVATIQPGLNNFKLYSQLFKEGLTHVGGTCSEVGLSGLVLSGGMGPLLRRVGLTCDSLISVDMVDAKGRLIHATKDNEHKDLFWATCGGGGANFGVITSMKLEDQFCFVTKNFMSGLIASDLVHIYHFVKSGRSHDCESLVTIIGEQTGRRIEQERFVYLTLADSLIENHNRHGRNLGFIQSTKRLQLAPFYDNPSALALEEHSILGADLQPRGSIFTKSS